MYYVLCAQPTVKLLIGGKFVESQTDQWINNYNPATLDVVSRVPCATQVHIPNERWSLCHCEACVC